MHTRANRGPLVASAAADWAHGPVLTVRTFERMHSSKSISVRARQFLNIGTCPSQQPLQCVPPIVHTIYLLHAACGSASNVQRDALGVPCRPVLLCSACTHTHCAVQPQLAVGFRPSCGQTAVWQRTSLMSFSLTHIVSSSLSDGCRSSSSPSLFSDWCVAHMSVCPSIPTVA